MITPSFREELISQIPALQLLMNLGYQYLTPAEALKLRGGKKSSVILEPVLEQWLREHNHIQYKGKSYAFTDANIQEAMNSLKDVPLHQGLIPASLDIYERLTLGRSVEQTIQGDRRSFDMRYIDWQDPANNVYHITDEFLVEKRRSHELRRPDIVLFVNGIPLVVIECKRPDLEKASGEKPVIEAVTQMIRNQGDDDIPQLFVYAQLLLAVDKNNALYATTGTAKKFWSGWQEENDIEPEVHRLINRRLNSAEKEHLYKYRDYAHAIRGYFDALEVGGERLPTSQDRTLYALLNPSRLLELAYQFIVYDGGVKKIARYQQYFAIKATIDRVTHVNAEGTRTGGVIWHTQGSGKSLTMVMLAKALALHPTIANPRIVLVTDRIDLDLQIGETFRACRKEAQRAESGKDLVDLVQSNKTDIITTVIDKFETAAKQKVKDTNPDVFVLVDESHRSQYGITHAMMKEVFRNACYIGFTGTPLLQKDKQTAQRFGGFIHTYTMRQAVDDEAVVPLLYEGRMAELSVEGDAIDKWFERVTADLSDDQKRDLKRKLSRNEEVNRAEQRLKEIAYDIADHYRRNFQGTGFKAQLAASSKDVAIKYKRYLDEFGLVTSAVIVSAPDTREGTEEVNSNDLPAVQIFWKQMMAQYRDEKSYNREITNSFSQEDGIEILIVVDKLLVGFDEPRNTVLYIDKPLRDHGILQAIARVNRLFEGKDFGYIVDYRGVLGELNEAINVYNALEGFDPDDVAGAVIDVSAALVDLPQCHERLWDVFKTISNVNDSEALERLLEPEDRRHHFYEALNDFARTLKIALSTVEFYETNPEQRVKKYKADLAFFHNLRASVRLRYAESISYSEYEQKIRKLMDSHIQATEVNPITELVNIFDREKFDQEVARLEGAAAKADTIAYRVKKTLTEKMDEDPAFYRKFSQLIDDTIEAYRQGRLDELDYLQQVNDTMEQVRNGWDEGIPAKLKGYKDARAYYGLILETVNEYAASSGIDGFEDFVADIAIRIEDIIETRKIRDWSYNPDAQDEMKNALEDYLYHVRNEHKLPLTPADMDIIMENVMEVARKRDGH